MRDTRRNARGDRAVKHTVSAPHVMHVLHSRSAGEPGRLVDELVRNSNGRFAMSVCCLDGRGQLCEPEGRRVFVVSRHERRPWELVQRLSRVLSDESVDIVHAHGYPTYFYAVWAAMVAKRGKVIFTEHGRRYPDTRSLRRAALNQLLLRRTDRVVALCGSIKRSLVRYEAIPARRVRVIYRGTDLGQFSGRFNRTEKRAQLGLRKSDLTVVAAMPLDPVKDPEMLIDAFAAVLPHEPKAKLLVAGDGPLRGRLEAQIQALKLEGKVRLLGARPDVPEVLRASDLFALSSRNEGASATLLEAMAAGLPGAATRVGGCPEIVEDGTTALLSPRGDAAHLGANIRNLLRDPERRREMGRAAQTRVKKLFDLRRMTQEFIRLYEELT